MAKTKIVKMYMTQGSRSLASEVKEFNRRTHGRKVTNWQVINSNTQVAIAFSIEEEVVDEK